MSHQLQWKQLNPPDEIIFTFIPPAALYMGENLPSSILLRGVTHTNDFAILRQNLNEFAQQMVEKIRFFSLVDSINGKADIHQKTNLELCL